MACRRSSDADLELPLGGAASTCSAQEAGSVALTVGPGAAGSVGEPPGDSQVSVLLAQAERGYVITHPVPRAAEGGRRPSGVADRASGCFRFGGEGAAGHLQRRGECQREPLERQEGRRTLKVPRSAAGVTAEERMYAATLREKADLNGTFLRDRVVQATAAEFVGAIQEAYRFRPGIDDATANGWLSPAVSRELGGWLKRKREVLFPPSWTDRRILARAVRLAVQSSFSPRRNTAMWLPRSYQGCRRRRSPAPLWRHAPHDLRCTKVPTISLILPLRPLKPLGISAGRERGLVPTSELGHTCCDSVTQ